jgi:hypothetical protein
VEKEMFFVIKAENRCFCKIQNDIFQKNDKSVVMMLSHRKLRCLGGAGGYPPLLDVKAKIAIFAKFKTP